MQRLQAFKFELRPNGEGIVSRCFQPDGPKLAWVTESADLDGRSAFNHVI